MLLHDDSVCLAVLVYAIVVKHACVDATKGANTELAC
jgi:hypothetical protein